MRQQEIRGVREADLLGKPLKKLPATTRKKQQWPKMGAKKSQVFFIKHIAKIGFPFSEYLLKFLGMIYQEINHAKCDNLDLTIVNTF